LIGSEIADARSIYALQGPVTLVGAAPVCALYAAALAHVGIGSHTVDAADATAQGFAGIHTARRQLA
jgi:2-dehydro-3-deoxygalactonokinase